MANGKILVVDDSPTDLRMTISPLQISGYTVVTATDGDDALAKAAREMPDLIVLDVVLPKKSGFQVCRTIKNMPKLREIKIILLSSKNQESDRFWGLKQGADVYMTKPFEDEELLDNVRRLLN